MSRHGGTVAVLFAFATLALGSGKRSTATSTGSTDAAAPNIVEVSSKIDADGLSDSIVRLYGKRRIRLRGVLTDLSKSKTGWVIHLGDQVGMPGLFECDDGSASSTELQRGDGLVLTGEPSRALGWRVLLNNCEIESRTPRPPVPAACDYLKDFYPREGSGRSLATDGWFPILDDESWCYSEDLEFQRRLAKELDPDDQRLKMKYQVSQKVGKALIARLTLENWKWPEGRPIGHQALLRATEALVSAATKESLPENIRAAISKGAAAKGKVAGHDIRCEPSEGNYGFSKVIVELSM